MELIADGAFRSLGEHGEAFELQSGGILEGVKIAPGGMELASHTQIAIRQFARVTDREREVQITPAAARKRFQFQVSIVLNYVVHAWPNVSAVVEDRAVFVQFPDERGHIAQEPVQHLKSVLLTVFLIAGIEPLLFHGGAAVAAEAATWLDDVQKQTVHWHQFEQLFEMCFDEIAIRGINAQVLVESRFAGTLLLDGTVGIETEPLGMLVGGVVIPLDRGVDRHADVSLMAGLDLLIEQVALEMRMAPFGKLLGVVIDVAVMAAPKASNRVHMGLDESIREPLWIEIIAYPFNVFAGMEIEMDLAEGEPSDLSLARTDRTAFVCGGGASPSGGKSQRSD